jgi:hypothetical protein
MYGHPKRKGPWHDKSWEDRLQVLIIALCWVTFVFLVIELGDVFLSLLVKS